MVGMTNSAYLKTIDYITPSYLADCFGDDIQTYSTRDEVIDREIISPIENSGVSSRREYDIAAIADRIIYQDENGEYSTPITPDEFWKVVCAYEKDRFIFDNRCEAVAELENQMEEEDPGSKGDYDIEAVAADIVRQNSFGKWGVDANRGELLAAMGQACCED